MQTVGDEPSKAGKFVFVARQTSSHARNCHSTRNGERQSKPHTRNHQRESTRRWITHTRRSTNLQNVCWQSNVPQSSSSRHSAQREHTFQINEESDDDSNTKAREGTPLLSARVTCIRSVVLIHMQELCKCPSTANGLTTKKLVKAAVEEQFSFTDAQCSHGHAHRRRELFRAQRPFFRHWLRSNRMIGNRTALTRVAVQNSTASSDRLTGRTCGVQRMTAWSNETNRAEDAHRTGMVENGTTTYLQSVDSRQPGRPHDQGHDSRGTDQVWTCVELARSILHSLHSNIRLM